MEDTGPKGQLILNDAGPDPEAYVHGIAHGVCRILYRNASEVPKVTHLTLIIRDDPGVAWKTGSERATIMLSSRHLDVYRRDGRDVNAEAKGVLYHEMTHVYQYNDADGKGVPGGLIEGVGDYVRAKAGYVALSTRRRGGRWDGGYNTTGWFLMWMDEQYPESVYRLNLTMDSHDGKAWTTSAFVDLTGQTVDELWNAYQATL
ncbi:MAG: basic secretory family protein [Proteobacteria bacterium]|nr:basic secretory family protein [Pseudomonadota bacterium]